jgi:hypothetical protein
LRIDKILSPKTVLFQISCILKITPKTHYLQILINKKLISKINLFLAENPELRDYFNKLDSIPFANFRNLLNFTFYPCEDFPLFACEKSSTQRIKTNYASMSEQQRASAITKQCLTSTE